MARVILAAGAASIAAASWLFANSGASQGAKQLSPTKAEGVAAFERVATVLESPRCMNCHPRGDRPRQGDDRHIHLMNVQRGPNDRGLPAMTCSTCHQDHNNDMARVPGARHWRLAPRSMGWSGLTHAELCRTLLDRSKNGDRGARALMAHMTSDQLVLWAWQPGEGRTRPALSTADLKLALELWVGAGTPCPN
jgi:hypothetical protein